jgi:hypothetical protein
MADLSKRAIAIGVGTYACLFGAYAGYALIKGVSSPVWAVVEVGLALSAALIGYWRILRGDSLIRAALIVSILHVGVRLLPAVASTLFSENAPRWAVPAMLASGLFITFGWFLLSRLVVHLTVRVR